jgi:hypothetical protein
MSLKAFLLLAPLALGGWWFAGGAGAYSREVDRTPAQVMAALADLDVRGEPGAPGTDPSRSGGVPSLFRTERGPNEISFVVMSGNQVATRMTARLEPLDGGRRTRVTAEVQRGDAPDDFVAPAFRSHGITMGLFTMALEGELNELTLPARKSAAECQELTRNLLEANAPAGAGERPANLRQAFGNGARVIMTLNAVEAELRRQGCDTNGRGGGDRFEAARNAMGAAPPPGSPPVAGANFQPGQPMVDVRPGSDTRR